MRRVAVLAAFAAALAAGLGSAESRQPLDYPGVARNVLPPGQSGSLLFPPTATDQLRLYDGLTPKLGSVTAADVTRHFKSARFGPDGPARKTVRPRPGVRIVRDRWDVPHVYGRTRADVVFGAGWATAEDRGLLMNLLRGPGRISALDVPGLNAFALATSARRFVSSPDTEAFLSRQVDLLRTAGPDGRRVLRDVDAYVAGINAYNRSQRFGIVWTRNDVIAVATLIGAVFGSGGGDEARASQLLDALRDHLGTATGTSVWNDLRFVDDPESRAAVPGRFPYGRAAAGGAGNAVVDAGSFQPTANGSAPPTAGRRRMSNALLIGRSRSATGFPLFVAGPQTGHAFPQILMELDLHGGGIDARGAAFPGVSLYVLIGRGRDYAWSATSANSDIVDTFVEELCGDDLHYRFRGECRAMTTFDAGVLEGRDGEADRRIVFRETVHGPVTGYATVDGRRVALSSQRSTRGREILSAIWFADLNLNRVTSARSFLRRASRMEMTFNWLYADNRDIAQFTSGRLPVRSPAVEPGLPTLGTGEHEWRGWVGAARHAQAVNPPSGAILNWNNRPARGFAASDDEWSWGPVHRVDLLAAGIAQRRKHTLASVVGVMNRAATQDLRAVEVWPTVALMLRGGSPPTERARRASELVERWRAAGASRIDRDGEGKIDDPGAAVLDAAWPRIAEAVFRPVLGPTLERFFELERWDDTPGADGNAYGGGWYSHVDKDLRGLLGPIPGAFRNFYCAGGEPVACPPSLWRALDEAAAALEAEQGPDPAAWRADAARERITYGFLPASMRFANRPTFQQVVSFTGHRPR
jgi:acyl-homoserine lactone acylase PvdQ